MTNGKSKCPTVVLSDEPAKSDAFDGSHSRVARAIARLASTDKGGKAIALEGTWGAGKSTVINLVTDLVDKGVEVFVYDAWAHEGDPLRRSFMESLIDFCLGRFPGAKNRKAKWDRIKNDMALKVRSQTVLRSPWVSKEGAILIALVFLAPMAWATISGTEDIPWWAYWIAFAFLFLTIGLAWWLSEHSGNALDRSAVSKSKSFDLMGLLASKETIDEINVTTQSPEPTSIEFQKYFDDLLDDSLGDKESSPSRLLVVIDNLDRVDEDDALAIWATMRTFLDFDTTRNPKWKGRLWVLIPYDPAGLRRLWSGSRPCEPDASETSNETCKPADRAANRAACFLDKTFQITFQVSYPALVDWHKYFMKWMQEALPKHDEQDRHRVLRVFEAVGKPVDRPVVPRDIILFINRLGGVHMQWEDEVPLHSQALFVALSAKHGAELARRLIEKPTELVTRVPVDLLGPEWQEAMAGLLLNLEPKRAFPLLMEPPITDALISDNEAALKRLAENPGFPEVCYQVVHSRLDEWVGHRGVDLGKVARVLSSIDIKDNRSWNDIWRLLTNRLGILETFDGLDSNSAQGVAWLLARDGSALQSKRVLECLTRTRLPEVTEQEPQQVFQLFAEFASGLSHIMAIADKMTGSISEPVTLEGSPADFVNLIAVCAGNTELSWILSHIAPKADGAAITAFIRETIAKASFYDAGFESLKGLSQTASNIDYVSLANACVSRLQQFQRAPEETRALLKTLFFLESVGRTTADPIQTLVNGCHLLHRLNYAEQDKDIVAFAACMLALFRRTQVIPSPHPECLAGQQSYTKFGAGTFTAEDLRAAMTDLTIEFRFGPSLIDALSRHPEAVTIISGLLAEISARPGMVDENLSQSVIQHFKTLRKHLPPDGYASLLGQCVGNSAMAAALEQMGFDIQKALLYKEILELEPSSDEYVPFLIEGVAGLTREEWVEFLDEESEMLDLVIVLTRSGAKLGLSGNLMNALESHADDLVNGKDPPARVGGDWSHLLAALSDEYRIVLLRSILDKVLSSSTDARALLRLYGPSLCESQVLKGKEENLFRWIVSGFSERLVPEEIRWVAEMGDSLVAALRTLPRAMQEVFPQELKKVLGRTDLSDDARDALVEIADLFGLRNE